VCRLRDIPIITFINKMDRESRDHLRSAGRNRKDAGARHHADDLAVGRGPRFLGTYDVATGGVRLLEGGAPRPVPRNRSTSPISPAVTQSRCRRHQG